MSALAGQPLSQSELGELRHELRTPFNAIVGYSEMLAEVAEDEGFGGLVPELEALRGEARELLGQVNAALAAGTEVRYEQLFELSEGVLEQVASLDTRLGGIRQQAEAENLTAARPDLDRIGDALATLERLANERLRYDHCSPIDMPVRTAVPEGDTFADGAFRHFAPGTGVILVVDDNGLNRDLLSRRLERQGFEARTCADGNEALEELSKGGIDLVMLDMLMPGIDGYEVLRRLKASPTLRELPVVMISALDDMANVARCIEMGAEDYLPKPFDPVLLRARVGACLEKKRLRDQELEYLRGVKLLQEAAVGVESGNFAADPLTPVAARDDELGRLARVFQRMASEVKAREERLKSEVRKLQIQIDERQKQHQLSQIMESDFAQGLLEKARSLRQRVKKNPPSSDPDKPS